ncbi:magnesium transporter [Varunaivibrio sulfuroxidans]|uniref:Magnesium transporter MgtE n=1 Tax=Varunaivibrio sulfuroxidans TaxID=1773489 RepID=A0A4R3J9L2_9PROT|nr:magnesium transporter [Varunaivibrio sulfuroxidans]TCS62095.1 magnesium transporter [Varunaivibrio sulfuroxidans]WES30528.1 magnesium transporter [Varunaivibrio sulfuroxidans]
MTQSQHDGPQTPKDDPHHAPGDGSPGAPLHRDDPSSEGGEGQTETALNPSGFSARIASALGDDDRAGVLALFTQMHPADAADVLEQLSFDQRLAVLSIVRDTFDPEILSELDETVRDEVIEQLGLGRVAEAIAELESDDAVYVLEELDEKDQQTVLEAIPDSDRVLIEEGLAYPDDSAGRLMQREVMTVPLFWTVGEAIDFMRTSAETEQWQLPDIFYDIFVVDPKRVPIGRIALSMLLRSKRQLPVADIMSAVMHPISVETDQEDVAHLFRQRDLVSAPVVDAAGRLVGAITIDDVVDVIDEEHEDDILRMGGVREDDLYSATMATTRTRFSWLLINLLTAILASSVIGVFAATIHQIVALAILMPIVASMGGNAGTQTLTVVVRALATKELTSTNTLRQVSKELMVGAVNGVLFAVLMGGVAWAWFASPMIGIVIALAMVVNMIVAGFAGATIPLGLEKMGVDPAIASSVFLTTVTDVVGFLVFLGLGTLFLL